MANRIYTQDDYDKIAAMDKAYQAKKDSYTSEQQKDIEKKISDAYVTVSNRIEESKNMIADMYNDDKWNTRATYWDWRSEIINRAPVQQPKATVKQKPNPNPNPNDKGSNWWNNNKTLEPIDWSKTFDVYKSDPKEIADLLRSRWHSEEDIQLVMEAWENRKLRDLAEAQSHKWEWTIIAPQNQTNWKWWSQKDTIVEFPEQNPENNPYLFLDETVKNLWSNAERISYLESQWYKPNSKWYYEKWWIKTRVYKDWQYNPTEVRSDNWQYITTPPRNDELDIALQEQWYNWPRDKDWHFLPKTDWATITQTPTPTTNKKVRTYNPVWDILNWINNIKTGVPAFINSIPTRTEWVVDTLKATPQFVENVRTTKAWIDKVKNWNIVDKVTWTIETIESIPATLKSTNDMLEWINKITNNKISTKLIERIIANWWTIATDWTVYDKTGKVVFKPTYPVTL